MVNAAAVGHVWSTKSGTFKFNVNSSISTESFGDRRVNRASPHLLAICVKMKNHEMAVNLHATLFTALTITRNVKSHGGRRGWFSGSDI